MVLQELLEILEKSVKMEASDIFIEAGIPVSFKIRGKIVKQGEEIMKPQDTMEMVSAIYRMAKSRNMDRIECGEDDFSLSIPMVGRFRVSAFKQRGSMAAVIRIVTFDLPLIENMRIPESVMNLSKKTKGLVLVTGPAGSGKSTTISYLIDEINKKRNCHILTLEDPIEYLHRHNQSIVSQREISVDTESYANALKSALRQSPDVILIGEMRDLETIEVAMTAAETGHLLLSTLHTIGAANTIDRVIDVFPPSQQQQVRVQLSMILQAVVSQILIPSPKYGQVAAFELLLVNNAVRSMIREGKVHQIDSVIYSSGNSEMQSLDMSILQLFKEGSITEADAMTYCSNIDMMKRNIANCK